MSCGNSLGGVWTHSSAVNGVQCLSEVGHVRNVVGRFMVLVRRHVGEMLS